LAIIRGVAELSFPKNAYPSPILYQKK